jgi:hypothetical protein
MASDSEIDLLVRLIRFRAMETGGAQQRSPQAQNQVYAPWWRIRTSHW